jgi:hypothetical protein
MKELDGPTGEDAVLVDGANGTGSIRKKKGKN